MRRKKMTEEVTKIIDTLCEKLGVAANYLIPELAKKAIAQDIADIILCAVALGAIIAFVRWVIKKNTDEDGSMDGENILIICLFPIFAGVSTFILFCVTITDLTGWIASPTAMAVEKITGMIR